VGVGASSPTPVFLGVFQMKKDDFNPFIVDWPGDPKHLIPVFETRIVFSKERNRHETEELKRTLDGNPAPRGN
jgi:hypothetical protein